jgi:hypothetical protein
MLVCFALGICSLVYLYILTRVYAYTKDKRHAIELALADEEARRAVKFVGVPNKR